MKHYNLKTFKPSPEQFYQFTYQSLSLTAKQSLAYRATSSLFRTAQKLYSALNQLTAETSSSGVDSQRYQLSAQQEHDLVALTALYVIQADVALVRALIEQDAQTLPSEKQILLAAVDLYQAEAAATFSTLGEPQWT